MTTRHDGPAARPRGRAGRGGVRRRAPAPAKIAAPRLPAVLRRARLFRWLDRARRRPVVWVLGPPGSGKTTLVASYLDSRRLPVLWYQIDQGDSDPATFFYYMGLAAAKAAAKAAPRGRRPLPLLTPEYRRGLSAFARRYFQDLYARLKPPFVLVFDNYQEVAADSPFHEVMRDGLAELPEGVRAILVSRGAPPPALSRFRLNRTMDVLGWDELRLTLAESRDLLRLRGRRRLSPDTLDRLHAVTEGWAAGLVLMAERLATEGPAARSAATLEPQEIFDYFAGELFLKADRETQDVLLQTAFLPRTTARMAEALTGTSRAGRILADLNRKNYFTALRAEPEPVYEYHPLFRQFLLSRAGETFSKARRARVQRAAAALLEAGGQVEGAAHLLHDAADWAGLARLIGAHAHDLLTQGRNQTLEEWLRKIPHEILAETSWLLYWLALCRLPFDLTEARRCFEEAYERFQAEEEPSGQFLAWAGVVETFVYEWGNFAPLDRWIAELDVLRRRYPEFPSPEIEARVATGTFCALIHRQPDHPEVRLWEQRVRALALGGGDARLRMTLAHHLVLYHCWWDADLGKADLLMEALRPAVDAAGIPPLARIAWHATEAAYGWMKANHAASMAAVDKGLELARAHGVHLWDFMLCANGVWARITSDDPGRAEEFLGKMASALDPGRRMDAAHYHFLMYLDAWHRGDLTRGAEHAQATWQAARDSGSPWIEGIFCVSMARVLVKQGERGQASDIMARAHDIARRMGSRSNEYLCLVTEAEWALDRGDEAAAVELLREVMAIGRQQGYVNHAWWHQCVMARLCALALAHGIEVEYVKELIRRRGLVPPEASAEVPGWPWPLKLRTLGRFAVLRDDAPLAVAHKGQRRPLDLLKALVAFGGREVAEERLMEALWPDAEGDAARQAFDTTLHRLRRLLALDQALLLHEGRLSLAPGLCWVDTWAFERLVAQVDAALGAGRAEPDPLPALLERILALYQGPFLGDDSDLPWALPHRERLRGRFVRLLGRLGRHWEQQGDWARAVDGYRRGLEVDELVEEFYQRLMVAYGRLGRRAEALATYRRCRQALATYLGVTPSPATETLAAGLRSRS